MATARPRPQVMRLTDAAALRIKDVMARADRPVAGVRVGVKNGGCAGMEYTMEYADAVKPTDEVVEDKGVKILVDPKAVLFLLGTEMDYKTEKLSAQFVFNNPNQTSACGCGESVQLTPAKERRVGPVRPLATWQPARGHFRISFAHHAIAAISFGGIETCVGALDRAIERCRPRASVATPTEIVMRPRCSPVERFISSLVITARRMCSATVIAARNTVLGRMIANSSPP